MNALSGRSTCRIQTIGGGWGARSHDSYNHFNGTYTSEHPYLLDAILRNEWGFDGLVISDWNSLYSTEQALTDGVDLEMPGPRWFAPEKVRKALVEGSVPMRSIDAKLLHLFTAYEKAGLFSRPLMILQYSGKRKRIVRSPSLPGPVFSQERAGPASLRKKRACSSASVVRCVQECSGGGSSHVIPGELPTFADECSPRGWSGLFRSWQKRRAYRDMVASSDALIMVTGFDHVLESEAYDKSWSLPKGEVSAIQRAAKLNSKCIVVVQSGGAVHLTPFIDAIPSLLFAFFLGSSTAKALTDIISGRVILGKTAFTIAMELLTIFRLRTIPRLGPYFLKQIGERRETHCAYVQTSSTARSSGCYGSSIGEGRCSSPLVMDYPIPISPTLISR